MVVIHFFNVDDHGTQKSSAAEFDRQPSWILIPLLKSKLSLNYFIKIQPPKDMYLEV